MYWRWSGVGAVSGTRSAAPGGPAGTGWRSRAGMPGCQGSVMTLEARPVQVRGVGHHDFGLLGPVGVEAGGQLRIGEGEDLDGEERRVLRVADRDGRDG